MSSWGKKFEAKLAALTDNASKESIQTVAKWVGFNRKHANIIAQTLTNELQTHANNENRQWLYWQLINEVLIMDQSNAGKWEKLQPLRTVLGETTIMNAIEKIPKISPQVNDSLIKDWDDKDVFGGPTITSQIKKLLKDETSNDKASTTAATESTPAKAPAAESSKPSEPASTEKPKEAAEATLIDIDKLKETAPVQRRSSLMSLGSLSGKDVQYDFESKGVPAGKVDSKEFLQPCKGIATLQIARDLRNDAPVQLGSLLDNLPKDILENLDNQNLSEADIEDYSKRISSKLLDLDLGEQLGNIATFKDIVLRQQEARKTLIHLLLKSRCQFGSNEAAEEFFEIESMSEKLKKRKQVLTDALELEGLDAEIDNTDVAAGLSQLQELSWYEKEDGPNKKARVEGVNDS